MFDISPEQLKKIIIAKEVEDKPIVLVLKGFYQSQLSNIFHQKLFQKNIDVLVDNILESGREIRRSVIMDSIEGKVIPWITMEEYLLAARYIHDEYEPIIVWNNLFEFTYPLIYSCNDASIFIERVNSEEEKREEDQDNEINKIYTSAKYINNTIWITYAEVDDVGIKADEVNYFDFNLNNQVLFQGEETEKPDVTLELTENEDSLLALIHSNMLDSSAILNVSIIPTVSFSANLYNYQSRLQILNFLSDISFYQGRHKVDDDEAFDNTHYLRILKENWGYPSFKKMRIYKNPDANSGYKEVREVSQDTVINSIVNQAEIALTTTDEESEPYRDIFVTAPTGAGKSILFQIPALYLAEKYEAMTIVISPLIGLMMDQVAGLYEHEIKCAETINSQISPIAKRQIIERIKNKEVHILYVSPETLLARSNIDDLIGDRDIGLIVIDEAHIVTTWGKSFRADYWYLGGYLQRIRKNSKLTKNRNFVISTFTATAIYGGPEDMYAETRDSLNLINPIVFLGDVKRKNINIAINNSEHTQKEIREKEYKLNKHKIALQRLERLCEAGKKTLVYFPTIGLIEEFRLFSLAHGSEKLNNNLGRFYGTLEKEEKNKQYMRFKSGETLVMLATKAFGMGIDIPDISVVYHFAPTGNVCDYIQEIGRAARDGRNGIAATDYLDRDFVFVNRLHGLSTLKKAQLIQVVKKILEIYKNNNGKRNMMINADDFKYIFVKNDREDADIDNKLKTALLVIEKDFNMKLQYSPLVGRPSGLFIKEFFRIYHKDYNDIVSCLGYIPTKTKVGDGITGADNVYSVDLKAIWEHGYQDLSFPQFKYLFYQDKEKLKLEALKPMQPMVDINVKFKGAESLKKLFDAMQLLQIEFGRLARDKKYTTVENAITNILSSHNLINRYNQDTVTETIISAIEIYQGYLRRNQLQAQMFVKWRTFGEERHFTVTSAAYQQFFNHIIRIMQNMWEQSNNGELDYFMPRTGINNLPSKDMELALIALGVSESLGCSVYRVTGGESPQIYLHIASQFQLERMVNNPDQYRNQILENVQSRHRSSVEIMQRIFTSDVNTKRFWDFTEDYFLGKPTEFG